MRTPFVGLALALALPALAGAQDPERAERRDRDRERDRDRMERSANPDFTWEGRMDKGRLVVVRNLNGSIRVTRAEGDRASIVAVKRWRNGDPSEVRIEQVKAMDKGDIIVCAFWTERATCDERGYSTRGDNGWRRAGRDVAVEFTIKLPAGVRVAVSSVNGEVSVEDATDEVEATSVNGSVWAASNGGPVEARTVNGDVRARMGQKGGRDLRFSSVNGTVIVQVPEDANADLQMSTVNGAVASDFPVTISGRLNPRKLNATLGKGGPVLELKTVNGDVRLRKTGG
jgi:ribosomal 30S subunit maturation factor RimM